MLKRHFEIAVERLPDLPVTVLVMIETLRALGWIGQYS